MKIKRITSLLMALTVSCGVIQTVNNYSPVSFTAAADEQSQPTVFFDEETGTLTLSGKVDKADVQKYTKATTVIAEAGTVFPEDCSGMFEEFYYVTSIDLSKADTSNVKSMERMFCYCDKLTSLDVSNFDTSNVTNMSLMFEECEKVSELDVSNFDTSNVKDMGYMFDGCKELTSLNLSSFDTSKVTNMRWMFRKCSKLSELDLSNFDTSLVNNIEEMFYDCSNLETLDISGFSTEKINENSDKSSLSITNPLYRMFDKCGKLKTIIVGAGWKLEDT